MAASEIAANISCEGWGTAVLLDALPPDGSRVEIQTERVARLILTGKESAFGQNVGLADVTGDGEIEPLVSSQPADAALDPIGALHVMTKFTDRCEHVPAGLGSSGLMLTRSGDDVLLHFDDTGLGEDSVTVQVFRGTIAALKPSFPYDHELMRPCANGTSPARDGGAAAAGAQQWYYLATRGCPSACWPEWRFGDLGSSSTEPRRVPQREPDTLCP